MLRARCTAGVTEAAITAVVRGATAVELRWSDPPLQGSVSLAQQGGSWVGTLGPFAQGPTDRILDYLVVAVDAEGHVATAGSSVMVEPSLCTPSSVTRRT